MKKASQAASPEDNMVSQLFPIGCMPVLAQDHLESHI